MTGYVHPQLHAQVVGDLEQKIADLEVQVRFWRQCAEHAVTGWNKLEDIVDNARKHLDEVEDAASKARLLLGSSDEWAPPENVLEVVTEVFTINTAGNVEEK